jgi:hypothetical protein
MAVGWDYQILSPVNRRGLALLGDTEKIVPLGKQRIAAVDDHGALTATIEFAQGETILAISGYASHRIAPGSKLSRANSTTRRTTRKPKSSARKSHQPPPDRPSCRSKRAKNTFGVTDRHVKPAKDKKFRENVRSQSDEVSNYQSPKRSRLSQNLKKRLKKRRLLRAFEKSKEEWLPGLDSN